MPARTGPKTSLTPELRKPKETLTKAAAEATAGYKGGEEMPLGPFAVIVGAYGLTMAGFFAISKLTGRKTPERVALGDIVLLGVATQKVSRLITKDWVTAPIRAPFTEFKETETAGE